VSAEAGADSGLRWAQVSEQATRLYCDGKEQGAIACWQEAHRIGMALPPGDPRRACALTNGGVACRLLGELDHAERCYREALGLWQRLEGWLHELKLEPGGRSTQFHLRRRRSGKSYESKTRLYYRRQLHAGRASCVANLGELYLCSGARERACHCYQEALHECRRAFGSEADAVTALITANLQISEGKQPMHYPPLEPVAFLERAVTRRWLLREPPCFTEEGKFMAAVTLVWTLPCTAMRE